MPGVRVADDLVERQFSPAAPNVLWVAPARWIALRSRVRASTTPIAGSQRPQSASACRLAAQPKQDPVRDWRELWREQPVLGSTEPRHNGLEKPQTSCAAPQLLLPPIRSSKAPARDDIRRSVSREGPTPVAPAFPLQRRIFCECRAMVVRSFVHAFPLANQYFSIEVTGSTSPTRDLCRGRVFVTLRVGAFAERMLPRLRAAAREVRAGCGQRKRARGSRCYGWQAR